jgi:hypothetical protein
MNRQRCFCLRAVIATMQLRFSRMFRALVKEYFDEESLSVFIDRLIQMPTTGALVPGLHGIRKIRAPDTLFNKGTRFGLRVLYSYHAERQLILLYLAYRKKDQLDILPHQRAFLIHLALSDYEDDDVWYNPRNN